MANAAPSFSSLPGGLIVLFLAICDFPFDWVCLRLRHYPLVGSGSVWSVAARFQRAEVPSTLKTCSHKAQPCGIALPNELGHYKSAKLTHHPLVVLLEIRRGQMYHDMLTSSSVRRDF